MLKVIIEGPVCDQKELSALLRLKPSRFRYLCNFFWALYYVAFFIHTA